MSTELQLVSKLLDSCCFKHPKNHQFKPLEIRKSKIPGYLDIRNFKISDSLDLQNLKFKAIWISKI